MGTSLAELSLGAAFSLDHGVAGARDPVTEAGRCRRPGKPQPCSEPRTPSGIISSAGPRAGHRPLSSLLRSPGSETHSQHRVLFLHSGTGV